MEVVSHEAFTFLWFVSTILGGLVGFAIAVGLLYVSHRVSNWLDYRRYYRSTRCEMRARRRQLKRQFQANPYYSPYS